MISTWVLVLLVASGATQESLSRYPGAGFTSLGGLESETGTHSALSYFTTPDALKDVARHFSSLWRRRGFPTVVDGDLDDEAVVSAFHTREGVQRSVVLRRSQGRTVGLMFVRDLWALPSNPERSRLEEGFVEDGQGLRTDIVPGTLGDVEERLHIELREAGFQHVRTAQNDSNKRTVVHQGMGEQRTTTLLQLGAKTTALIQARVRRHEENRR
jgi:hypothetical protein